MSGNCWMCVWGKATFSVSHGIPSGCCGSPGTWVFLWHFSSSSWAWGCTLNQDSSAALADRPEGFKIQLSTDTFSFFQVITWIFSWLILQCQLFLGTRGKKHSFVSLKNILKYCRKILFKIGVKFKCKIF